MEFKDLDISIYQAYPTKAQQDLKNYIENEYSARAAEIGKDFYNRIADFISTLKKPEYAGTAVSAIMRKIPRSGDVTFFTDKRGDGIFFIRTDGSAGQIAGTCQFSACVTPSGMRRKLLKFFES